MTNPLKLIDIFGNQEVMLDITRCADSLFNYDQHRACAIVNAKQIYDSVDQNERDNVFGIYGNGSFVGITGLWYDENQVLKDLAMLRWTSLCRSYRGLRLSPYIVSLIAEKAKAKDRSMLVEIAHTEGARDTFLHLGFKVVENNDRYIKPLLNLLGEANGNYILTMPIVDGFVYDWERVYALAKEVCV